MNIRIFDNGGKTFDRYSVIDMNTGDIFTTNGYPTYPDGMWQYSHTEKKPNEYYQMVLKSKNDEEISIDSVPEKLKDYLIQNF